MLSALICGRLVEGDSTGWGVTGSRTSTGLVRLSAQCFSCQGCLKTRCQLPVTLRPGATSQKSQASWALPAAGGSVGPSVAPESALSSMCA